MKTLLIIENSSRDYLKLFANTKTIRYYKENGEEVEEELRVEQVILILIRIIGKIRLFDQEWLIL